MSYQLIMQLNLFFLYINVKYLCYRAGHPSWFHNYTAMVHYSSHEHSLGSGHTHHRTVLANHNDT